MHNTVFDIETTGFGPDSNTVLAFAYATFNTDFTDVIAAEVKYYYKEGQPVSAPKAFEVHRLSEEFLRKHEDKFEDNCGKMFKVLTGGNLFGYNSDRFDIPFVRTFLRKEMYGNLEYNSSTDLMKVWKPTLGRSIKLTALKEKLMLPEFVIESRMKAWFGEENLAHGGAHDAAYDVTVTALILLETKRRGML